MASNCAREKEKDEPPPLPPSSTSDGLHLVSLLSSLRSPPTPPSPPLHFTRLPPPYAFLLNLISNISSNTAKPRTYTKQTAAPAAAPGRAARLSVVARSAVPAVGIMARKAGMTQIFTADGLAVPATLVSYKGGNVVTAVRTVETDGYAAVQVGFGECKEKALNKPELGHLKKSGAAPMRTLVEFRLKGDAPPEGFEPGAAIDCSAAFAVGEMVDVAGTSIGKGFQGTIKRWNHKRGLMSHGSKSKRQHGSIGSSATPSRVLPGLRMAGRMGGERVKIRGLEVLAIEAELGALVLKGSIPGKVGNVVEITKAKVVGKNC